MTTLGGIMGDAAAHELRLWCAPRGGEEKVREVWSALLLLGAMGDPAVHAALGIVWAEDPGYCGLTLLRHCATEAGRRWCPDLVEKGHPERARKTP